MGNLLDKFRLDYEKDMNSTSIKLPDGFESYTEEEKEYCRRYIQENMEKEKELMNLYYQKGGSPLPEKTKYESNITQPLTPKKIGVANDDEIDENKLYCVLCDMPLEIENDCPSLKHPNFIQTTLYCPNCGNSIIKYSRR